MPRLLVLACVLALSACGNPADRLPPLEEGAPGEYRLGTGDTVRVITFDDPRLTGEFRVNDAGRISLPLVGSIPAAGHTPREVEVATAEAMRRASLFRNPSIAVEVITYRPIFVLGQVERPGQFAYQPGMTVLTAVAIAGGFTYRAFQDEVSVTRPTADNIATESRAGRAAFLKPGDVVTVFERRF
jgi:polysaccharide export outer membrane protein